MIKLFKSGKIQNLAEKYMATPLYLALVGFAMILIGNPYNVTMIMSMGTAIIFGSVCLGVVLKFLSKNKELDDWWLLGLLIYSAIFSMVITSSFDKSHFVTCAMFLEIPFFLYFIDKRERKALLDFLFFVFSFLAVYFLILSVSPVAFIVRNIWGESVKESLTLGFSNPNQTGMHLMTTLFVLVYGGKYYKNVYLKIALWGLALFTLYLCFLTRSRTIIVLVAIFIAYSVLHAKIPIKGWMTITSFIVPILFVLFLKEGQFIYEKIKFLGDSFENGRLAIYDRVFYELDFMKYCFGDVSRFNFQNLHNAFLTVFANLGLLGTGIYIPYMIGKLISSSNNLSDKKKRIPYFGILLIFFHACTESAFFSGGSVYAVSVVVLFLLCNSDTSGEGTLYENPTRKLF